MMNQLLDLGVEKERIGYIEEYEKNYCTDSIEVVGKDTVIVQAGNLAVKCHNEIEYGMCNYIFCSKR